MAGIETRKGVRFAGIPDCSATSPTPSPSST
jgi:hypothetical protein